MSNPPRSHPSVSQKAMPLTDKHFADWESHVFGYGYGTGEPHTLNALKTFLAAIARPPEHTYDYNALQSAAGATVAWLLISILCRADILEYGTSPRYGWLTKKGELLRDYVGGKTVDELYDIVMRDDNSECYPDHCNCESPCNNPLFAP